MTEREGNINDIQLRERERVNLQKKKNPRKMNKMQRKQETVMGKRQRLANANCRNKEFGREWKYIKRGRKVGED